MSADRLENVLSEKFSRLKTTLARFGFAAFIATASGEAANPNSTSETSAPEQGAEQVIPTETPLGSSERQTLLFNVLSANEAVLQSLNIRNGRISRADIENVVGANVFITPVLEESVRLAQEQGYDVATIDQGVDVITSETGTYLVPNIRENVDDQTQNLLIPYEIGNQRGVVAFPDRGENFSVSFLILNPLPGTAEQPKALPVEIYTNSEGRKIPISIMGFQQNPDTGEITFFQIPVRVGQVNTNAINVRNPNNHDEVLTTLPRETEILVIGEDNDTVPSETSAAPNARFARIFYNDQIALAARDLIRVEPTPVTQTQGQEVAMAPEAFLTSYQWQNGDIVQLVPTGRGRPDQVNEHWQLSIQRGETWYGNLPVTELFYGGYVRPLGIEYRPDYSYPTYIIQGIYLGQKVMTEDNAGTPIDVFGLIVAVPSRDGRSTLILEAIAPRNHRPGFSIGGGMVLITPSQEIFDRLPSIINPGAQIKIDVAQADDGMATYFAVWRRAYGTDCQTDPICQAAIYAYDQSHSTTPDVIYDWWLTGNLDESRVIRDGDAIRTGALTQVIVARPPGSVY